MGLSSWIQNVLARSQANARKIRSAREDFVQLFLTRLEDRRVLNADFALVGTDSLLLENFTQTADENLTIQDTGTEYQFILSEGLWNGTDGGGLTGNGTNTLTVDKTLINNTIQIQDSAAIDVDIAFGAGSDTVDFSGLSGLLDIDGAGAISQGLGTTLLVGAFDADAASLSLDEATNDFDTLTINVAADAVVHDADEVMLGTVTTVGSFQLTAGGAITEAVTPGIITTGANLEFRAGGDLGAAAAGTLDVRVGGTASLSAAGDIFVASDQNLTIDHLETAAAQADIVEITTSTTANLTLQVASAEYLNLETDTLRLTTADGVLTIQGETLTAGSIVLANSGPSGSVLLDANLQTDGGDIDLQNTPNVTLAGTVTLDTELGDDNDAGDVLFSTAAGAEINASTSGADGLMINTTSAGGIDGNVTLSDIGTTVRLGVLSVIAGEGTITLNDTAGTAGLSEILTDGGTITFGSFTQLTSNTSVSTLGGDVNWQNTIVYGDAGGPYDLTIDTDGGTVQLGRFTNTDGVVAGTFVNNLAVDTTGVTAGQLRLHGDITLANNFQYTGGTVTFLNAAASDIASNSSITTQGTGLVQILATAGTSDVIMQDGTTIATTDANVTINATNNVQLSRITVGGANTAQITAGGAITDGTAGEGAGNENIIATNIVLSAANGIGSGSGALGGTQDIDIDGDTLTATNSTAGAIQIFDTDDIAIDQVGNANRAVVIEAGGAITDADAVDDSIENIVGGAIRLAAVTGIGSGTGVLGEGQDIDIIGESLTAINTTSGAIQIFEIDDLALEQVTNPNGTVVLDVAGGITDATPADDSTINLIALQAALRAGTGIGVAGGLADIDTTIGTLAAQTNLGEIAIDESDALIIGAVGGLAGLRVLAGGNDDDIIISANGPLTIDNPVQNVTGNITLTAEGANDLLINANVLTGAPGNITLTGQNVTTGGVSPTIEITGDGTIATTDPRSGPVTGTGIITINASGAAAGGITTIGAGSTIRTGGGVIQITTDDIVIDPTALIDANQANGGVVMIRTASAGRAIELGGNVGGAVLNLSDAELDRITADSLRIGRRDLDSTNDSGDITFTATFSAPGALPKVQLFTGGNITQAAGAGFIANQIGIEADGSVMLGDGTNDAIISLSALAGGGILFNDANSLTVGQISDDVDNALPADGEAGIVGVVSTNSFVELIATNGDLIVPELGIANEVSAGGVNSNNVAISLLAASAESFININAGANVFSIAGSHRYTADNMAIDGTITATGQAVNLRNANAGVDIHLGTVGDGAAGTLELSDAELDRIDTNLLAIGRNTGNVAGDIQITASISPLLTDTLHLITPGTITDAAGGAIIETNLLIESGGSTTLDNLAAHDVDTLAAIITGIGSNLIFRDVDDLAVGTVRRLIISAGAEVVDDTQTVSGITTNGRTLANNGGDVLLISETGNAITNQGIIINSPITTTASDQGRNSGAIILMALGTGDITVNSSSTPALDTRGTTTGGNGRGGNITLTTQNASITINAGDLNALGGSSAVDGGNITIDAGGDNSDINVNDAIITNDVDDGTVRGSITITADDAIVLGAPLVTSGLGIVTVTANDSAGDGDSNGVLLMNAGSSITAAGGLVTLQTRDHLGLDPDNGGIITGPITTANGNILIDANGPNADVTVQSPIVTVDGGVTVRADDSIVFQPAGMISAPGAGNVIVRANENASDGDGADEIDMADGSVINSGTGTVTLSTQGASGGDITLGQVITQNITNNAVTIISNLAVVDGGDSSGADIIAIANAASRVNITAVTGVGAGNAIETSAVRFDVQNTGAADVSITNVTAGLDVVIERLTTRGGNIAFVNLSGTGLLTITGTGVASGDVGVDGGNILINTSGNLVLETLISSRDGQGGTFTLVGGAIFNAGAAIDLGAGDIDITTGGVDILINADVTIAGGSAQLQAVQDIIVGARLQNISASASILTLLADQNNDGAGGVLVRNGGQVVTSGSLTLAGSDLIADSLLLTALDPAIENGVHIEADAAAQPQLLASGDLILQNQPASGTADLVLGGLIQTQSGADILIDANQNIHLADDTTIISAGNVTLGDGGLPRQDAVIDDFSLATPSNLMIQSAGSIAVFGRIGDAPSDPDGSPGFTPTPISERIDSLTADDPIVLLGGFVSTRGNQTYGDDVFLHASTDLVNSTTITAGGAVVFNGAVRGFDFDSINPNTPIEDDLTLNVTGITTFTGQVGVNPAAVGVDPTQRIGDGQGFAVRVLSIGETLFNSQVFTESGFLQAENAGRITFREDVSIGMGDSDSFFLDDVTLDSLTIRSDGSLTFGSPTPNQDELFIFLGSGLDTASQSKNITINSRVSDPIASMLVPNEDLRVTLFQGDLLITGSVGSNANRFGDLIVVTANDFVFGPDGLQSIVSESFLQETGIENGADQADTLLNGTINTSKPDGIVLATTNLVYNADVVTDGGQVLTQAAGTITYTSASSITTTGGLVVSDAAGTITMQETAGGTATIDSGGAAAVLRAGGDLIVSKIVSPGGLVSLTSTGAAIMDAGDQFALGSAEDIISGHLRLQAATGIGLAGNLSLETAVSNLEAANGSGGIVISNSGSLTIGGLGTFQVQTLRSNVSTPIPLPTLDGVSTQSGVLQIVATGPMTVSENVIDGGGPLTLMSMGGMLTLPGTVVRAAGGNIQLTTFLGDTTFLGNLETLTDNGIFVDAIGGTFTLGGNILSGGDIGLRSDAGWIANPGTTIRAAAGSIAIGVIGDATFQGQVAALGGNHIFVDATGNFTLENGFQTADLLVEGNGQIVVTADGSVNFGLASGALVQSGTGAVLQATPQVPLELVSTPQVSTEGEAILSLVVGVPGERNFQVIIDWGDGTPLQIVTIPNGGVLTSVTHTYENPPDPTNPGAPIPIFVAVVADPHIHFFGDNFAQIAPEPKPLLPAPPLFQNSPPNGTLGSFLFPIVQTPLTLTEFVNIALDPRDFSSPNLLASDFLNFAVNSIFAPGAPFPLGLDIDNLGVVTVADEFFEVPTTNFGTASVIEPDELPAFFVPGASAQPLPEEDTEFDQDAEDADFSGGDTEDEGEDEVQVRLRVLSPAGQVLFEYDIDARYLSNPLPLWQRLTDGRYQIVIVEPGSSIPLIVRDVQLRDHKVIRRFDRTQRGTEDDTSRLQRPLDGLRLSGLPYEFLDHDLAPMPDVPADDPDEVWENWRPSPGLRRLSGLKLEPQEEAESDTSAAGAGIAGTLAIAAARGRSLNRADDRMRNFTQRALSPAARLRRRLRK